MRSLFAFALLFIAGAADAHDLITAESAQRYLENAVLWQQQSVAAPDHSERARADLKLGMMLDEIRDLLNRDLAVHGEVQGLASNYLVAELKRVGTPLAFSERRHYFMANAGYYRAALQLGLEGDLATEARLRLLRGEFYDSFGSDPFETDQTSQQFQQQLDLVDKLMDDAISEPDLEEVRFIAAIVYARAAKLATDTGKRSDFRDKALATADRFERQYPDSLRTAAMPVIREALRALR